MHLIQADVNLIYIRDLLGHADVSTTEIYARADAESKRKAIENAYQPLTPDAHTGLDTRRFPDRLARNAGALTDPTRIMCPNPQPRTALTRPNTPTGHITRPSA